MIKIKRNRRIKSV